MLGANIRVDSGARFYVRIYSSIRWPLENLIDDSGGFGDAFGEALGGFGEALERFGEASGVFGEASGASGEALGGFGDALGSFGDALGTLWRGFGEALRMLSETLGCFESLSSPRAFFSSPIYKKIINSQSTASAAPYYSNLVI